MAGISCILKLISCPSGWPDYSLRTSKGEVFASSSLLEIMSPGQLHKACATEMVVASLLG